jgi:hypothetical protein
MAAQGQNLSHEPGKKENVHEHDERHDDGWHVLPGTLGGGPLGYGKVP